MFRWYVFHFHQIAASLTAISVPHIIIKEGYSDKRLTSDNI